MKKPLLLAFCLMMFAFANLTAQTINSSIWHSKDYTKIPDSLNIPNHYSCSHCSWNFANNLTLKSKSLVAVRVTFSGLSDSCFYLTSKFNNISLASNGKTIHPYAILWESDSEDKSGNTILQKKYMTNDFNVDNYKVFLTPKKQYDLILLFSTANIGDSLVIEGFINTVIVQ